MAIETLISTIRHGHTEYNAQQRYAGSRDVPLSIEGVLAAQRASTAVAESRFDVVVASTLQRAVETARLLVNGSVPIVRSRLCNERRFGEMEGLTWEEVQDLCDPILTIRVGPDIHTINPRGGEPFEDVWERAKAFRRLLFNRYLGRRVLVVSHGVFLQLFHGLLRGQSCIESLAEHPKNLEMTTFRFVGLKLVETEPAELRECGQRAPELVYA
jgi:probable phosphoglycerate mutase